MKLTRLQYQALKAYWAYHSYGINLTQIVKHAGLKWSLLLLLGTLSYLLFVPVFPAAGWVYIGVMAGAFIRDVGNFWRAFRLRPISEEIINWSRVSELIEAHEKS